MCSIRDLRSRPVLSVDGTMEFRQTPSREIILGVAEEAFRELVGKGDDTVPAHPEDDGVGRFPPVPDTWPRCAGVPPPSFSSGRFRGSGAGWPPPLRRCVPGRDPPVRPRPFSGRAPSFFRRVISVIRVMQRSSPRFSRSGVLVSSAQKGAFAPPLIMSSQAWRFSRGEQLPEVGCEAFPEFRGQKGGKGGVEKGVPVVLDQGRRPRGWH